MIIGELLKLIVVVCMMFYTDWRLALMSLIAIPLLLIATDWFKRNIKICFSESKERSFEYKYICARTYCRNEFSSDF